MTNIEQHLEQAVQLVKQQLNITEKPCFFVQTENAMCPYTLFDAQPQSMQFSELPGMPQYETPDKFQPELLYGKVNGYPVMATHGQRHLYEGNGALPCILPLCIAHKLGAKATLVIDAGLSLRKEIKPGTWLMLTDYINGHACSPLDGNHAILPDAFPDMSEALSQHLISELINALDGVGISPKLGIFMSLPGSQFCTVSEAEYARKNGADIIGHNIIMEIIMAHALGMETAAFALAASMAPTNYSRKLTRADYLDTCSFCIKDLLRGLRTGIKEYELTINN